ncbi:hypothetical protein BB558_002686 [Smittium angustum]|nr:hypothetical protein BB558_002686 [Smittium angustum]
MAMRSNKEVLSAWEQSGQPKITLKCKNEDELMSLYYKAKSCGITCQYIVDAGRTQIAAGSTTVLGIGPGISEDIDKITKHLKLY